MRRDRQEPESGVIGKIQEAFRERLTRLWLRTQHTPRDAVNAVCTAGLAAAVTYCPTSETLSAIGLGVIANIVSTWLVTREQENIPAAPPEELIEQVLASGEARREITSFLREQNLLWDHTIFSSQESQERFSMLLLAGLQEYGVATKEDTDALKSSLAGLHDKVDELLTRVKPQVPTAPTIRFAVPFPGDRVFVGREKDLTELHKMLGEGRLVAGKISGALCNRSNLLENRKRQTDSVGSRLGRRRQSPAYLRTRGRYQYQHLICAICEICG